MIVLTCKRTYTGYVFGIARSSIDTCATESEDEANAVLVKLGVENPRALLEHAKTFGEIEILEEPRLQRDIGEMP